MNLIYVLNELPGSAGVGGLEVRVEYGHYVWRHHHPDGEGRENLLADQNNCCQAIYYEHNYKMSIFQLLKMVLILNNALHSKSPH